ncbi:hypothetical protein SFMTTN_1964 [Sulfuriferula multivorans]|uniref:Uncharacterized protein n=1 Tax=Sulfuriferula multivorans TaxID=1559896 RepID=A0A401JEU6_9PROT|nr:hypothetical protein SFMTTN_1964 [Sulfuriferula multivorans]
MHHPGCVTQHELNIISPLKPTVVSSASRADSGRFYVTLE